VGEGRAFEVTGVDASGEVLAWARCTNSAELYAGSELLVAGANTNCAGVIEVRPPPGQQLALFWGSKNDARTARLTVNGKEIPLHAGGFDGYRWLDIPLPDGLTGERYEIVLLAGFGGRPAFFSEIRLRRSRKRIVICGGLGASQWKMSCKRLRSAVWRGLRRRRSRRCALCGTAGRLQTIRGRGW